MATGLTPVVPISGAQSVESILAAQRDRRIRSQQINGLETILNNNTGGFFSNTASIQGDLFGNEFIVDPVDLLFAQILGQQEALPEGDITSSLALPAINPALNQPEVAAVVNQAPNLNLYALQTRYGLPIVQSLLV